MANLIDNCLSIITTDRALLDSVVEKMGIPEELHPEIIYPETDATTHLCFCSFVTKWYPAINIFEDFKNRCNGVEGVIIEANWVDEADGYKILYRWLFDDQKYEVVCPSDETFESETKKSAVNEQGQLIKIPTVGQILDFRDRRWELEELFKALPEIALNLYGAQDAVFIPPKQY